MSLTYDARRGVVTRHAVGSSVEVGTDVFAVLEDELAAGSERTSGSATSATPPGPTCPRRVGAAMPDAVWMRARNVRLFEHEAGRGTGSSRGSSPTVLAPSATDLAAVVRRRVRPRPGPPARRQLLRGQPDLPARAGQRPLPGRGLPAAARAQPRAVRRLPAARPAGRPRLAAELVAGAVRPGHRGPHARDQADQGHHPARRRPGRGRAAAAASSRPTRSSAPRT